MNAPAITKELAIHQSITLDMLSPSKTNPRKRFDEAKLKDLAESIKTQGVLQPILVRQVNGKVDSKPGWPFPTLNDQDHHFEIVAGERRFRAAKLAGITEVPCFI